MDQNWITNKKQFLTFYTVTNLHIFRYIVQLIYLGTFSLQWSNYRKCWVYNSQCCGLPQIFPYIPTIICNIHILGSLI